MDTTPPNPPADVFVEEGGGWQANSEFNVWWDNPVEQQSPIAVAHYELCPAVPLGPCVAGEVAGENVSSAVLVVPHIGWFWLRLWLEDAAGNVNPAEKSTGVMLRFDDAVPPQSRLVGSLPWLNASAPDNPPIRLQVENGLLPLSGVRGYSIALDGDLPDGTVEAFAEQDYDRYGADYTIEDPGEGVTELQTQSISNSGVPSVDVTTSFLRIDRSPPTVAFLDPPEAAEWRRDPVGISVGGTDQIGLSGMTPAPLPAPADSGGHLLVGVDDGTPQLVRGDQAAYTIAGDGLHSVSVQGVDVAGNSSGIESVAFKIDGTPPTGAFLPIDPTDPRQLIVDVHDATSGVAGGYVEYRRVGEGSFRRLPTSMAGGRLRARIDDSGVSAGRYEYRAVVRDVAGSQAVISTQASGKQMTLLLPVRIGSKIEGELSAGRRSCVRPKSRAKRKRRPRRCGMRAVPVSSLPFGTPLAATGRLRTAGGAPIPGARVTLEARPSSGGPFAAIGAVTTNGHGRFTAALPAGPSRSIRYGYGGSNTVRPSRAVLTTKVKAAARLMVSRRRLRNGQSVVFRGRLLGRPIPLAGKLVALQAKVGRRWRTFATPRADSAGAFRHRYRFTSTTGLRRYAFRALVTRESAYPYEKGASKIVRVSVRGRTALASRTTMRH